MNRLSYYITLVGMLLVVLLVGCTQPAPDQPTPSKPAGSAPAQPTAAPAPPKATETAKPAAAAPAPTKAPEPAKPTPVPPLPPAKKDLPSTMGIGSGTVGGGQHAVGTGIAKVVSDHTPIKILVKPFAGPAAWMPMIESGELELGVISGPDAGWAYRGETGYPKANKSLRMVMSGNLVPVSALTVRKDSDIKSIKDLKGKRVTSEFGGNLSIRANMTAALESVGLTWNDVRQVPVADIATGLRALREGRADAAFGGHPAYAGSLELDAAIGLRLLNFGDLPPEQAANASKELIEIVQKHQPGGIVYRQAKQGWLKTDATMFSYPVLLVASAKTSVDALYEIVKAVYQYDKELQPVHDWTKDWKQETMFTLDPAIPYHEGAILFWKELGKWTPQAEANQKKALGQ